MSRLTVLAHVLGAQADERRDRIAGVYEGVPIAQRMASRGDSSNPETWTEIQCMAPPGPPLALHIQRHGRADARHLARGHMVDLVTGDAPFDAAFRVEAAPAAVVLQLLTPALRAYLASVPQIELETIDGALRLSMPDWVLEPRVAAPAWHHLAALCAAIPDAHARAAGTAEERQAEVASLVAKRGRRARAALIALIVFLAVVAAMLGITQTVCHVTPTSGFDD